jgi:hypothetical protein
MPRRIWRCLPLPPATTPSPLLEERDGERRSHVGKSPRPCLASRLCPSPQPSPRASLAGRGRGSRWQYKMCFAGRPREGKVVVGAFFTAKGDALYAITPWWPARRITVRDVPTSPRTVVTMLGLAAWPRQMGPGKRGGAEPGPCQGFHHRRGRSQDRRLHGWAQPRVGVGVNLSTRCSGGCPCARLHRAQVSFAL